MDLESGVPSEASLQKIAGKIYKMLSDQMQEMTNVCNVLFVFIQDFQGFYYISIVGFHFGTFSL